MRACAARSGPVGKRLAVLDCCPLAPVAGSLAPPGRSLLALVVHGSLVLPWVFSESGELQTRDLSRFLLWQPAGLDPPWFPGSLGVLSPDRELDIAPGRSFDRDSIIFFDPPAYDWSAQRFARDHGFFRSALALGRYRLGLSGRRGNCLLPAGDG